MVLDRTSLYPNVDHLPLDWSLVLEISSIDKNEKWLLHNLFPILSKDLIHHM